MALAGIVVLAALLRLPSLSEQSLWLDEAVSWSQANGSFLDVFTRTAEDTYPPLHNVLLFASIQLFGDGEWALRLPSALLGIANVALIFWLGRLAGGRRVGAIAALLLATSGFHIWYSQEARMYALLALAATGLMVAVLQLQRRPSWLRALAVALCGAALLYTHPYGLFTWLSIGLGGLIYAALAGGLTWRRLAWLALPHLASLLAFAPWIPVMLATADTIATEGFWIAPLTSRAMSRLLGELCSGPAGVLIMSVGVAAALVAATRQPGRRGVVAFLVAVSIGPLVAGVLLSLLVEPLLVSRYLIGALPAGIVLAAIGIDAMVGVRWRWVGAVVLAAVAGLSVEAAHYSPWTRPDWRSLSAELAGQFRPGDCILLHPVYVRRSLDYYRRPPDPCAMAIGPEGDLTFPAAKGAVFAMVGFDDPQYRPLLTGLEQAGWGIAIARFGGVELWRLTRRLP